MDAEWTDKELASPVDRHSPRRRFDRPGLRGRGRGSRSHHDLFIKTGHPPGTVNLCAHSAAKFRLVVRHLNRVGVLAFVLDGLREEGINVEEMENTIFAGTASGRLLLDAVGPASVGLVGRRYAQ